MCDGVERGQLCSLGPLGSALGIAIGQVRSLHRVFQFAKWGWGGLLRGCCENGSSVSSVTANARPWRRPVLRPRGDVNAPI